MNEFKINNTIDIKDIMNQLDITEENGDIDIKTLSEILHLNHEDWSMYERLIHSIISNCGKSIETKKLDDIITASRLCIQSTIIDDDIIDIGIVNFKLIALSDIIKFHWIEKITSTGLISPEQISILRLELSKYHNIEKNFYIPSTNDTMYNFYKNCAKSKSIMLYLTLIILDSIEASKDYIEKATHIIEGVCLYSLLHDDIYDLKSDISTNKYSPLIALSSASNRRYDAYFNTFPNLLELIKSEYYDTEKYIPSLIIQRLEIFYAESKKVLSDLQNKQAQ